MGDEETLQRFSFFNRRVDHIHDLVDDALTFDIVTAGPIIRGTRNFTNDAAFIKKLRHIAPLNTSNDSGFKVDENRARYIFTIANLMEENLQVGVSGNVSAAIFRRTSLSQAMLTKHQPPKTVGDLVATLSYMNAQNLSHGFSSKLLFIC